MFKYYFLLITILLFSCKQNPNTNANIQEFEMAVDDYQPTAEELEQLRIEDSINIAINSELLKEASLVYTNGSYTHREDIITILLQLDFISGFKANTVTLQQIVPDPNSTNDAYLKSCVHTSNSTIEFIGEAVFGDDAYYPIASISNLDTDYYFIEKITVAKDGGEIEMSIKRLNTDGSLTKDAIKPFMVYHYNYYVLEFYNKSFAVPSIVENLEEEICEEEDRG